MRLPDCERAHVDGAKIRDYLVSATHAQGARKARRFADLAFTAETCDGLAAEFLRLARTGSVAERVLTVYGTKYVIDGLIRGPAGYALIRTIWMRERISSAPRLLTACVIERNADEGT